jgi:hypothetical protein
MHRIEGVCTVQEVSRALRGATNAAQFSHSFRLHTHS